MRHRPGLSRARRQGDRGSSTIEFLLLTPLLVGIVFSLVQFGMYYFAKQVTEAAAQAGARKARATAEDYPNGWADAARTTTASRIQDLGPALVGDPSITPYAQGDNVGVVVTADVVSVVPWIHLHVTSRSVGPIERFIPDAG
ncbi:pilus assembly protein [Kitasatospora paracochleata]|uniref:Flp pilus assembly protein TadG n=1 Tax=Kitasatospora paracochleata TaxID=58354 RepID=A0ABT1JBB4_9ACTN|nr:TadE family protein [Kitasatospora paracochleata]MCP2313961.1 Flp pilus assembly protein TadG [Kitasatospora paracochleata]